MKINKKDPKHWAYMALSGVNVILASLIPGLAPSNKKRLIFYGHTLNGNLKSFAEYANTKKEFEMYFATQDPRYYKLLNEDATAVAKPLSLLNIFDVIKIARSSAVITDRRTNVLEIMNKLTRLPFIDVWHGIAYKGFSPADFKYIDKYEEIWVSSPTLRDVYIKKYEVDRKKLYATGYSRTDGLFNGVYDVKNIKKKYDISNSYKKIVLVAPTWQQDDRGRDIIPFGVTKQKFFSTMNQIGRKTNTLFIFRAHLNVEGADKMSSLDHVKNMPYAMHPDVEEFLAISDMLVTDWSSLVFDYLVLRRPAIFLDVKPPFRSGFSLGPEYRFGEIVNTIEDYGKAIEKYLAHPKEFSKKYDAKMDDAIRAGYGDTLDGKVSERQYKRLIKLVNKSK